MSIRRWMVTAMTAVALVACGSPSVQTVVRIGDVTLTRTQLDARIERIQAGLKAEQEGQEGQPPAGQLPSNLDIEKQLVELFIRQTLLLSAAQSKGITVSDAEIDSQIEQFRTNFEQQQTEIDKVVQDQLGYENSAASEFRQFVSSIVAQDKLGQTLVTTDTVEAEVTQQVNEQASQEIEEAHALHILVATAEEAQDVLERLDSGEAFEDIAKEVSTDTGSGAQGGDLGWARAGQFVPEFDKAVFEDLEPGETTTEPVQTQFGYHIIRLQERRKGPAIPADQVPLMIEQQVQQQVQQRRQQEIEKLLDEERKKATEGGLLEEPIYPTATPMPTTPPDQLEPGVVPGEAPAPEAPPAEGEPAETPVATPAP